MKKLRYLLPLAAFGLVLSSCGGDGIPLNYKDEDLDINTEWEDYDIPATGVVFSDKEQHLYLEKGTVYEYSEYYISPKGATATSLDWSSSDPSIATIEDGVVTAVNGGRAKIYVSEAHQNFAPVELIVDVTNTITDFAVHAPSGHEDLQLDWNNTYQFTYDLVPTDTTDKDLIWSIPVEEQAYAKIDNKGLLTTYAVDGDVHLTVKSPKLEKEVKFDLVIRDREIHVQSISLSIDNPRVEIGKSAQLSAEVTPSNADDAGDVKYLSSDPSIASVDINTGLVTANSTGKVELWANADGVDSNHVEFEVYEVYATGISIDKSHDYIVTSDEDVQLVVNVETSELGVSTPTNATVKYESNNPSVISISDSGVMSAHESGSATITASIKGQGLNFYEDSVTVTSKAYVSKITISGPTSAYMTDTVTLTAEVEPNSHEVDPIIWTINPEEKVEAEKTDTSVTLTPLATGPVTVTATSTHSGVSATHTVSFSIKKADYTLAGDFNSWADSDQTYALVEVESGHYRIEGVELYKGSGVKVVDINKTWYSNATEYEGCGYTLIDDGYGGKNMSLNHSGVYTIDFYPNSEYGNTIVFTKTEDRDDPVVETHYYLVGDFNSWTQLDENYEFTRLTDNHYRLVDVELETGKAIKVMDNALPKHNWFANATDGWEGCEYVLVDDGYGGKNVEVKVGGTYTIDFYVESEYGNHIIFHSGEVPPEPEYEHNWYLEGSVTGWELDETLFFSKDTSDSNHYYIANLELEFGDVLKAYNPTTDTWLGTNTDGSWWTHDAEGNLVVGEAGSYYVNLYVDSTEGNHISLWKETPAPETIYYVEGIGGVWEIDEAYAMSVDSSDSNHYNLGPIELAEGTELKVYCVTSDSFIGSNPGYTEDAAHWTTTSEGNLKVIVTGDYYVDLYVEHGEGNHIKLYYAGGDTPIDPPVPGQVTYTVTNLPDWIQNDGCVIFAWVWSANDTGSWKALTINGTTATFTVNEELTGFLLVRCISGTTTPNWSVKTDTAGRIYNQTEDITCTSSVHSYSCSSWKEYNPQ